MSCAADESVSMSGLSPIPSAKPTPTTATKIVSRKSTPWHVVIYDDPVNIMDYVTLVIQRIFGYPESTARKLMLQVHEEGRSIVWTGEREKAEFYVRQLLMAQLQAQMEKASGEGD